MKPYCIYTLGLILLACATLTACMEEEDAELQTQLVVEGWIEDGVAWLGEFISNTMPDGPVNPCHRRRYAEYRKLYRTLGESNHL